DLFVADGMRLWEVNAAGITAIEAGDPSPAALIAGDGYLTAIGDGAAAAGPSAILHKPSAVALDPVGNLFIADTGTQRVREVSAGGILSTVAGNGVGGTNDAAIAATAAEFNSPMGVALDPSNDLFVADTQNSSVLEIAATVTPASIVSLFAGTGVAGLGQDNSAPSATPLYLPHGVCTASDGSVYIADTWNYRVLKVPPGGNASTFAGNGSQGNAGDGYPAQYAQLDRPAACALDGAGDVFIADTYNHSIREVSGSTGIITTVAGTGAPGFAGDGGAATSAALDSPSGVAADNFGDIFIADTGNHAIRLVTPDGLIHTIAGQGGTPGFSGDKGAAANALLNSPSGMVLDGAGNLYFADTGNNRVRVLAAADKVVTTGPAPVSGLVLVNAASQNQGSVAPGEIVTIYGVGIGPSSGVTGSADAAGSIGDLLAGVQVFFDGVAAPLFYVQATQINAQAPYTVAGELFTSLVVSYQGQSVGTLTVAVEASAPGLFGAALNQDGSINSSSAPAARATAMTFFGTGEGLTSGANLAGQAAAAPYPAPLLPVTLTVGGVAAQLLYAGEAPGFAGLLQVDAVVPGGFVPSGPVPVQLTVGVETSPSITVWLQ
ncbi:MAG TPA: hypothetical protein VMF63_12315, partial [Opitutaceae bacterium]|nr:hypothetical protein [Opitutaceae bacterium]